MTTFSLTSASADALQKYAEARQLGFDDALALALRKADYYSLTKAQVNKRLSALLQRLEQLHKTSLPWFSPSFDSLDLLSLESTATSVAQALRVFYSLMPSLASQTLVVDDNTFDLSLGQSEYSRLAIALLSDASFAGQLSA